MDGSPVLDGSATVPVGRVALWLAAAGGASLVGAGALLWWRHGEAVFADYVTAALAWCF